MTTRLTGTGIWSSTLRYGDAGEAAALAAELEELGYSALWIPDVGGDLFGPLANLLGATTTATIATGILNVWMHTPEEAAAQHASLTRRARPALPVRHRHQPPPVDRPRELAGHLPEADRDDDGLPRRARRRRAAAGRRRSGHRRPGSEDAGAGSHPHRRHPPVPRDAGAHRRRPASGSGPTGSSPASKASCWRPIPTSARATARLHLKTYLGLPNYSNNWKRQGFTDDDLADGGSDRLVDALVVWGDEAAIAARVQEHRDAGADHVCIQVLTDDPPAFPTAQWRALAAALT